MEYFLLALTAGILLSRPEQSQDSLQGGVGLSEEVISPSFDQGTHNVHLTTQLPQPLMIIVSLCKSLR